MIDHKQIDAEIRRFTDGSPQSRPFLCSGSPIGCEVAEVGINPGTDTPFWDYWRIDSGCDKQGWLQEYRRRNGGQLKPTRDRIEVLCDALKLEKLRCLELNLYHRFSRNEASLKQADRDTTLFDFMLSVARPQVLLVHGAKPIRHLERLLCQSLKKGAFTPASYQTVPLHVFAADRHFAYVSRDYVRSVAKKIIKRVRELKDRREVVE